MKAVSTRIQAKLPKRLGCNEGKEIDRFASESGAGELHSRRSRTVPDCQRNPHPHLYCIRVERGEGEEGTCRVRATFRRRSFLDVYQLSTFLRYLGTISLPYSSTVHPFFRVLLTTSPRVFSFLRTRGRGGGGRGASTERSTTSVISTPRIPHRVPAYGPKS